MSKKINRILIVEDDKPSSLMLKKLLETFGYEVADIASTGEDAVKSCEKTSPRLVLMDITLKGTMDGIEAAKRIKEKFNVPCMFLTVNSDDEIIQRAKETAPYGYLIKPYNRHILLPTIEMAFARIEAEEKIRESERRNREILSSIPDIMFRVDKAGRFLEGIDAVTAKDVWPEKMSARTKKIIESVLKTGKLQIFDYVLKRTNETRYYEARIIHSGEDHALVVIRDETEKKRAEKEVEKFYENLGFMVDERTKELSDLNKDLQTEITVRTTIEQNLKIFSHAIKQIPAVVVIINRNGVVEYVNDSFTSFCGYEFDEVVGRSVNAKDNCVIPEPELWDVITEKENWAGEFYNVSKHNEVKYLNARISTIRDEEDKVSHYILIGDDITDSKREKQALEKIEESIDKKRKESENIELEWQEWKEKMLSRNISRTDKSLFRNINNSFTQGAGFGTLITLLDLMNASVQKKDDKYLVDGGLYDLILQNQSIAQNAFKTFADIDSIISSDLDLDQVSYQDLYDLVKAAVTKIKEFLSYKDLRVVMSEFNPSFASYSVNINREYLFTALNEVLINAVKFSKNKSVIAVMLYSLNKNIILSVVNDPERSDEGILGIPAEYEKVVFEPFYRITKYVYEHYKTLDFGLGLTLVEKIVNKHGGEIIAENIIDHTDLKREPQTKVNITITLPIGID